jgi:mercuric ion transport protein
MQTTPSARTSLVAGAFAALGATACCLGPLLLVTLGIGGVWLSAMGALEPFRPIFIGVAALFFGVAFHRLYIVPRRCAPGDTCAVPVTLVRQKIAFWILLIVAAAMLLFPLYAHWFY